MEGDPEIAVLVASFILHPQSLGREEGDENNNDDDDDDVAAWILLLRCCGWKANET